MRFARVRCSSKSIERGIRTDAELVTYAFKIVLEILRYLKSYRPVGRIPRHSNAKPY